MPPSLEEKLTSQLRSAILSVTKAEADIKTAEADVAKARKEMNMASAELIKERGARDGLAILFLPENMTLQEAWDQDYKQLRTGT